MTGNYYTGGFEGGKKNGKGLLYDNEQDEVVEGEFEMDRKQGECVVYKRSGEVLKTTFRGDKMDGEITYLGPYRAGQIDTIFS